MTCEAAAADAGRTVGEAAAGVAPGEGTGLASRKGVGIGVRAPRVRVAAAPGTAVASAVSRASQAVVETSAERAATPINALRRTQKATAAVYRH